MPVTWISIAPASPTTQTPVTLTLHWYGCYRDEGFERIGNTFHYFYDRESRCAATAPDGSFDIALGRLAAGAYSVHYEFRVDGQLEGALDFDFAVGAGAPLQVAQVTAIGPLGGCALALMLLLGAAFHARRRAS